MAEGIKYHVPVMLEQCMEGLNINPDGIYVDVTFGGGGHSSEILKSLKNGSLYGFDQDEDAIANIPDSRNFTFVRSNFKYLKNFLRYYGVDRVDGILADLGVSSHHFDDAERGFSFRFADEILDMRMNRSAVFNAADVVNGYSDKALSDVFYYYGELRNSRKLSSEIIKARNVKKIETVSDLLNVVEPFFSRDRTKKDLAKLFQALRIEVNGEMDALKELLKQGLDVLNPGGRFVVMTYHSLEDRIVKNFFKTGNLEGKTEQDFFGNFITPFKLVNKKVMIAGASEQKDNPRSRSAKLRIAEKK